MSFHRVLQTLRTVKKSSLPSNLSENSNKNVPKFICNILSTSESRDSFAFSDLTPTSLHQILSNPNVKASICLRFFNFLIENQFLLSFQPDLEAHLTLVCRLLKARLFSDAENLLKSASVGQNPRYPFLVIASFVENCSFERKVVVKFFNSMLKVYSDDGKFHGASEVFDYMVNNGVKVDERTCTIHLCALKKAEEMGLALQFFSKMVEAGLEVSVFSLTAVVNVLCESGEIKKARELVEEMLGRGVKANIITYNLMLNYCAKRWDFGELDMVLALMAKQGEAFNVEAFKVLIDGFTSCGKFEEAEKCIEDMHKQGMKADTHMYNMIISGYCKLGLMENGLSLFARMSSRGVELNADSYCALVNGFRKIGDMKTALKYVNEMKNRDFEVDQITVCTSVDGCARKR